MELTISHSSLRLRSLISQRCKASSNDNMFTPIFKHRTKDINPYNNLPKRTNKLTMPVSIYGQSRFSKPSSFGQHKHKFFQASAQPEETEVNAIFVQVSRFGYAFSKFLTLYALRLTLISCICLYARVLVKNPGVFRWSLVFKAFPGLIAMLLANAYYNGLNQIYDVDVDRVNKPHLPIPAGELSLKQAWFLVIFEMLAGLSILRLVNADLITTSIYYLGLFLSTSYSAPPLRFKNSYLGASLVNCLMGGILYNVGILYASTTSLGLPFNLWSPPIVFITTFITLFFLVIINMKDLTDVEGDMKHNIRTLPAIYGPKKTTFLFVGILLLNYIGAIVAAICMPQAFNPYIMVPAHAILAFWILLKAIKLDKANYIKEESAKFYQVIWKTLAFEYLLLPFI